MEKLEEKIKRMSKFRPNFGWSILYLKDFQKCWEEFLKITEGKDSEEYNLDQFIGMNSGWGECPNLWNKRLEEWSQEEGKLIEGDSEEYVRFQLGTSKCRAELFIESGKGYVMTEDIMGSSDWDIRDRWFGLQISLPGVGHRSCIDRLYFYAENQACRLGDKPVVLTGLIQRKFIYCQKNYGEYCLSRKDYDKIKDPEILGVKEYELKYLS